MRVETPKLILDPYNHVWVGVLSEPWVQSEFLCEWDINEEDIIVLVLSDMRVCGAQKWTPFGHDTYRPFRDLLMSIGYYPDDVFPLWWWPEIVEES